MVREIHAFDENRNSAGGSMFKMSSDFKDVTYDAPFKNVFSIKRVLAVIIKETIELYQYCSVDDVAGLIESVDPMVTVKPGTDDKITISESYVKGEGTVKFDILVKVGVPADKVAEVGSRYVQVRLNLEMQRNSTPNYPLSYRGLYYGSRLISDQIPKIDQTTNYGILMPVFSV
ncbi:MAG: hypothetical protein HFH68_01355 [Lachnospiraceae bacterium]|nr:hypothetical protein [Lachnospiraceae bacterium]